MSVFGIFLIIAATVMQSYVLWRAVSLPANVRHVSRRTILIVALLLWAVFAVTRILHHSYDSRSFAVLELIGMNWLASLFLLSFCALIADIATGFGLWFRNIVFSLRAAALAGGILLSILGMILGTLPPVVHDIALNMTDLPAQEDGIVIVALSDLHVDSTGGPWLSRRAMQVQKLKPDMIVLLGDLVELRDSSPPQPLLPAFRGFSAPLGVWAVPGNHESFGRLEKSGQLLETAGISMLQNQWREIRPGLILVGIEDLTMHRYAGKGDPVAAALNGRPRGATILLSHSPLRVSEAASAGVTLMLCGHTHNGQIWPFNYLVQRMYPYMAGTYRIQKMVLIVTRAPAHGDPACVSGTAARFYALRCTDHAPESFRSA